uniref:Fungal lipase-type domain-containing protein n=1 Tax=Asterionellopsis glacialis TaxID=33640 RepID=A0A7S0PT05_9STRA
MTTTTTSSSSPLPSSSSAAAALTTPPETRTTRPRKQSSLRNIKKNKDKNNSSSSGSNSPEQTLAVPTLTPLHGFLTPSDNLAMRSSEQEPSSHQIELPSCEDILMHGRLCSILHQYRQVDQNFDFSNLVGTTRMSLQGFVCSHTDGAVQDDDDDDSFAPSSPTSLLRDCLIQQHTPILQSLLECSSNDDVIVEGFFTNGKGLDAHSRMEVTVFNCQAKRQFIVVYRGTSDQQTKPIRTKEIRKDGRGGASGVVLHPDQPVQVFPSFRESYFSTSTTTTTEQLETQVFALLDTLSERYPFCDVVMTGHSFGGALATIAGLRYASSREMMRVSCHIFGSPKVGGKAWRHTVNSTPNLKVIRIEHGNDPYVNLPSEHGSAHPAAKIVANAAGGGGGNHQGSYMHVGHTVVVTSPDHPPKSNNAGGTAIAYRFEKNKPTPKNFLGLSLVPKTKDKKVASQHGIETYVRAMEQFARLGFSWVKNYHGEDGKGVTGSGNEKRQVV